MNEITFFHVQQFYYQNLAGITGFGGVLLLIIWFYAKKGGVEKENRRGLVFLALALFSWTLPAIIYIFNDSHSYCNSSIQGSIFGRVLSEANNMFLILTIPYFPYGFEPIKQRYPFLKEIKEWIIFVLIVFFVIILLFSTVDAQNNHFLKQLVVLIDTFISIGAICLVGYRLGISFTKRHYGSPIFIITAIITLLLVLANIGSAVKGLSDIPYNCEDFLLFQRWLSLLFSFSISCFTLLIVSLAHSWMLEEKNMISERKEKIEDTDTLNIAVLGASASAEEIDSLATIENTYTIEETSETNGNKISPKESLFLKFTKVNDKFVLSITDLSKQILAYPIILNENGKGKKVTQPYMGLLVYALAKLNDNLVQEKASKHTPIHLPDIIAMNNQIRTNLINPALKKSNFEEINKDDLLERENQKAYQLRVPKTHIQIEIWEDMLRPMSELQEFIIKCGFSENTLTDLKNSTVKNT